MFTKNEIAWRRLAGQSHAKYDGLRLLEDISSKNLEKIIALLNNELLARTEGKN